MAEPQQQDRIQSKPQLSEGLGDSKLPGQPRVSSVHERRQNILRTFSDLDLSSISELKGLPNLEIASIKQMQQRSQIATRVNTKMQSLMEASPETVLIDSLKEFSSALIEAGKHKESEVVDLLANHMQALGEKYKEHETPKTALNHAELKRTAELIHSLADSYGFLVDFRVTEGKQLVLPVDARISIASDKGMLSASIVGFSRECGNIGETSRDSGLIILDPTRFKSFSAKSILANELAHSYLSHNFSFTNHRDEEMTSVERLKSPELPGSIIPAMHGLVENYMPTNAKEVGELRSDSWSTLVDRNDVDRILASGIKLVTGDSNAKRYLEQVGYDLSANYAVSTLISSRVASGIQGSIIDEIKSIAEDRKDIIKNSLASREEIDSIESDEEWEQAQAVRTKDIRDRYKSLDDRIDSLVSKVTPEEKDKIVETLKHYADSFVSQLAEIE